MFLSIKGNSEENIAIMFKRIFLDTNPIIYFLENEQGFGDTVKNFLAEAIVNGSEFYTSTITDAEFLVRPYQNGDFGAIEAYETFLKNLNVLKCFVTDKIAESAAKIRAKYSSVKLGDSLQLAASIDCGCDCFYSNDSRLKQVIEANVIYFG